MTETLLTTKFHIPSTRPKIVLRPRLIKLLNEGIHRKLTLISAPAGFGKTTLVTEWLENLSVDNKKENPKVYRIAWLSLDDGDNDLVRFLSYFIAVLNQLGDFVMMGEGILATLKSPQPPPTEEILTKIINDIVAIPNKIILVLDDYHVIEEPVIDTALTFLIENLPPQLHIVITTRVDPNIPLSRLRAKDQISELRAADLRFTSGEAAEFLNQVMGLNLSEADISVLETRTEGWIAGLQLAAISMQGSENSANLIKSFTGSHRYVLDYLIEEVLDQQPEDVKTFLLQTAILDRMFGSLCDTLTDQEDGQAKLEMLDHANLFIIPLDADRCCYRYHHLFADLLRQRLNQTQPEKVPILHRKASIWFEQNGYIDEAIEYALRTNDYKWTADLIEKHVDHIWHRGEHTKLRRWLSSLPDELVCSKPHLCIFQAWDLFLSGKLNESEQRLEAAEGALVSNSAQMELQGRVAAIRAFVASFRSDGEKIISHAQKALEHLPETDFSWRITVLIALGDAYGLVGKWSESYQVRLEALELSEDAGNPYLSIVANLKLAVTLRQQGQLKQTIEICQKQLEFAKKNGLSESGVIGWLFSIWGITLADKGDLEEGSEIAQKGMKLVERHEDIAILGWSHLSLLRIYFSMGDLNKAQSIIQKLEILSRKSTVPPWILNHMSAYQARIWLAQGKLDAASQWVEDHSLDPSAYVGGLEYGPLARILIAQGRLDETIPFLQHLLETAVAGGHVLRRIEILMLQALAFQVKDDINSAINALEKAIALAEQDGFIAIFVDEGTPMTELLNKALDRGISPVYIRRILATFPIGEQVVHKAASTKFQVDQSELIEPLSEREIEVLHLVAEGFTNPEIASRLYLSLNTVKVHTRNIYGKLCVNNRTQAAAKAKELGVLPSK